VEAYLPQKTSMLVHIGFLTYQKVNMIILYWFNLWDELMDFLKYIHLLALMKISYDIGFFKYIILLA